MRPEYRNNRDDAPRIVAAMARTYPDGDRIPLHIHKRGQLIHAISGTMKVETADAAWRPFSAARARLRAVSRTLTGVP